jgi:hypothetical protein
VYALGYEKGMEMINTLEGVEAIFFTEEKQILLSEGARQGKLSYSITNQDYWVEP